ncbi:hypothetical protein AAHC03_05769 [Spirometra sp. Aus1]
MGSHSVSHKIVPSQQEEVRSDGTLVIVSGHRSDVLCSQCRLLHNHSPVETSQGDVVWPLPQARFGFDVQCQIGGG